MALSAGTQLGPYEILSPLGAGGMGEVYRARDAKLGREVAIKVLPEEFTQHPEKLARFEREARLLAALNHPGIATLHGLEESGGEPFLVMELVEGETLAERIARGPLPAEEALQLSRQIAEALEAAHERGVIHRDLKPANIKVDAEGQAKVLDFGLAKAWGEEADGASSSASMSQSPTLAHSGTQAGVILGTASYMSPEQAKGKVVDKRTDVFSFGVVLFEMLAGRKAFAGEDVSDVLAGVIKLEPEWQALPSGLDGRIQGLLRHCLRKDRKTRRQSMGDVRVEIEDILADPTTASSHKADAASPSGRPLVRAAVWAAALLLAALVGGLVMRPEPPAQAVTRFALALSPGHRFGNPNRPLVALSPDGARLVYAANGQLYVREMDQREATPIRGTDSEPAPRSPFFSPDGQWVGFEAGGVLKKVSLTGAPPVTLCEAAGVTGASWGADDLIVFGQNDVGIVRVSANGGTPDILIPMEVGERGYGPQMLPDGETVLFNLRSRRTTDLAGVRVLAQSLATGDRRVLVEGGGGARYVSTGHLVYARAETLLAAPFDLQRLEVTGSAVPLVESVLRGRGTVRPSHFDVSDTGAFVYLPGAAEAHKTLGWVNRAGEVTQISTKSGPYEWPRLSPDGKRIALASGEDIWIHDIERDTMAPLTTEGTNAYPVWSPDGQWVAFASQRDGDTDLYRQRADFSGPAEILLERPGGQVPTGWSPDAKVLIYLDTKPPGRLDLWALPLEDDREPRVLLETPLWESEAGLSPNGRWLAYQSNDSDQERAVYVQPFPDGGRRFPISTGGGTHPRWSPNGRELFYRNGPEVRVVEVETEQEFRAGTSRLLFEAPHLAGESYDVAPDGQRFLMILPEEGSVLKINVVLNWFEELKRLVPTD